MADPLTYADVKALAEELDRPISTLIALAPDTDPFMAGRPAREKEAEWFAEIWRRFDIQSGAHIRRVHYLIISQEKPVRMPDGRAYENTLECGAQRP